MVRTKDEYKRLTHEFEALQPEIEKNWLRKQGFIYLSKTPSDWMRDDITLSTSISAKELDESGIYLDNPSETLKSLKEKFFKKIGCLVTQRTLDMF